MPTYQYACTGCGHQLEAVQSFTDPPLTVCPECDGALRKVFSAVGVVFKGSGFYRTDSRATPAKAANGHSPTSAPDKSGTDPGGKSPSTDAKPAAATSSASGSGSSRSSSSGSGSTSGSSRSGSKSGSSAS